MLKISTDVNAWKKMTEAHKSRIKSTATKYVKRKTLDVFNYVTKQTPQLTGDLVANWQVVVGVAGIKSFAYEERGNPAWPAGKEPYIEMDFRDDGRMIPIRTNYEKPREAGDMSSMVSAIVGAKTSIGSIKWNSRILLVNTASYANALTQPGKRMGFDRDRKFQYRAQNLENTEIGVLQGEIWNIKPMTIMRFKYLGK